MAAFGGLCIYFSTFVCSYDLIKSCKLNSEFFLKTDDSLLFFISFEVLDLFMKNLSTIKTS